MNYSYQLHERAQQDYEEALRWYLQRNRQAAENFVVAVDNALALICAHPGRWRNQYKHYHELGLQKYPYTIIYSIEEDRHLIIVSAIYIAKEILKRSTKTTNHTAPSLPGSGGRNSNDLQKYSL